MNLSINTLVNRLIQAREAYYFTDKPLMSDADFDTMEEELRALAPEHPYFSSVGITPSSSGKIRHQVPMLSMGKVKTPEELKAWLERLALPEGTAFTLQPKIDGLSASCLYHKGKLVYVATRGDGRTGQDISYAAQYMEDIPFTIESKEMVEIRGELYLPKDTTLDTKGKPLRNNCVGLINRKEERQDIRHVRFVVYQIARFRPSVSEAGVIRWLNGQGFHTVSYREAETFEEISAFYGEYLETLRDQWLYETDGLIVTLDNSGLFDEIDSRWVVDHHHHYAVAFKPPSQGKETRLNDIEWQVSRQGSLIPVASFEPIELGGATLSRASLHNYQFVRDNRLDLGDRLLIERANDVIPYVRENLDKEKKPEGFRGLLIPSECPACRKGLTESGVHLKCTNPECPETRIQKILYWVKSAGIENIAEATVRLLYDKGKIRSISDLYSLKKEELLSLEGFADKKADILLVQVALSASMTAPDFISRLGIPLVQRKALAKLGIRSLRDFLEFNDEEYVIGQNIITWREENRELFNELCSVIEIKEETDEEKPLICMTGKGPFPRKELEKRAREKGYEPTGSVTKATALLLTDDITGTSSKLKNARKLGIPIQSYDDFLF